MSKRNADITIFINLSTTVSNVNVLTFSIILFHSLYSATFRLVTFILIMRMLLIIGAMDLRKICILPYIRLINCPFHLFWSSASSFSSQYLLLFVKSPRNCSSSSYSFHSYHLSFNGIMNEAISSQNMTDPIGFST